ncbi:ELM1/GtrOC1 family putative glycosyltransferase [Piscinibacter koreensis]|uniref:Mitochondrial fission ELM1 family protein n=1 Tax=Piscinibacter koreensis TaxID=2742824 RepID=A0A7Y6TVL5_9BURK|nr:ELM1/GtrOC1 family putative glycosyltransferase [Schlegelella koreensis]NUZ05239.1 mitochondrial fission ELM1 family protein [Schlegelella koreensis]
MSSSQPVASAVGTSFDTARGPAARPEDGARAAPASGAAADPAPLIEPIVLAARPGAPDRPAVRIFLGTEPAQYRAERIFVFALEQVRNPDRRYEIYRMSRLPAFDEKGWRTGFTNYRFAIPALAGGHGRAIYNDVDQVWFGDPAELFDQPMDGHGYLALSPRDTAVMLIDCARMLACWSYDAARRRSKKSLHAAAEAEPGRWGALDPVWHARDTEFVPGRSKLLHFTALDAQPWQPLRDQYTYRIHPHAERFLALEHAADVAGWELYRAERPSPGFTAACERARELDAALPADVAALARELGVASIGHVGAATLAAPTGASTRRIGLGELRDIPTQRVHAVAAWGLEQAPPEDLPWLVDRLFARAGKLVYVAATLRRDGSIASHVEGWRRLLRRVGARYPDRCWQLDCRDASGHLQRFRADRAARASVAPTVWVLLGSHAGDNAQLVAIADALGWPCETKKAVFSRTAYRVNAWLGGRLSPSRIAGLAAPWPDLVISAGRRSAPVARWIRARSGGRARIVNIGRSRVPLSRFDLVLTTPQYGVPLAENVVGLPAPYVAPRGVDAAARARWTQRFATLPRPWIALLVGGSATPYRLDPGAAAALGRQASEAARARGGSLLVTTSPRTSTDAARALLEAIDAPHWSHQFGAGDENPYAALLALADAFIVTGDSATMLAEVSLTGRPVAVFPTPIRRSGKARLRHAVERWCGVVERDAGDRGVERQQGWRARAYLAAVAAGLRRERRFEPLHEALGLSTLPGGLDAPPGLPPALLEAARARAIRAIRELVTAERPLLP